MRNDLDTRVLYALIMIFLAATFALNAARSPLNDSHTSIPAAVHVADDGAVSVHIGDRFSYSFVDTAIHSVDVLAHANNEYETVAACVLRLRYAARAQPVYRVVAYSQRTLSHLWTRDEEHLDVFAGADVRFAIVEDILLAVGSTRVVGFDVEDGSQLYNLSHGPYAHITAATIDEARGRVYVGEARAGIWAIDVISGDVLWNFDEHSQPWYGQLRVMESGHLEVTGADGKRQYLLHEIDGSNSMMSQLEASTANLIGRS